MGRRKGVLSKSQQVLSKFKPQHHAMFRKLVIEGAKASEVAQEFNISESRLSVLRSQGLWQKAEDKFNEEMMEYSIKQYKGLIVDTIRVLRESLNSSNPPVRLWAAKVVLDKMGLKAHDLMGIRDRIKIESQKEIMFKDYIQELEEEATHDTPSLPTNRP